MFNFKKQISDIKKVNQVENIKTDIGCVFFREDRNAYTQYKNDNPRKEVLKWNVKNSFKLITESVFLMMIIMAIVALSVLFSALVMAFLSTAIHSTIGPLLDTKHFALGMITVAFISFYLVILGTNKYVVQKYEKSFIKFQKAISKKLGMERPYTEPSSVEALKNNPVRLTKNQWDLLNNLVDEVNQSFEIQQAVKDSPMFWRRKVGIDNKDDFIKRLSLNPSRDDKILLFLLAQDASVKKLLNSI